MQTKTSYIITYFWKIIISIVKGVTIFLIRSVRTNKNRTNDAKRGRFEGLFLRYKAVINFIERGSNDIPKTNPFFFRWSWSGPALKKPIRFTSPFVLKNEWSKNVWWLRESVIISLQHMCLLTVALWGVGRSYYF